MFSGAEGCRELAVFIYFRQLARVVLNSSDACKLALVWDIIHAGAQAGRFAGEGFNGSVARLIALSKRPGTTGRAAGAMMEPPSAM